MNQEGNIFLIPTRQFKEQLKNLNLKELKNKKLIDDKVAQVTSQISSDIRLRQLVLNFQKQIAYNIPKGYKGSILNGRDITHNIVPDATFKFYVTASLGVRSKRRYKELKKLGNKVEFRTTLEFSYQLTNKDRVGFSFGHISCSMQMS